MPIFAFMIAEGCKYTKNKLKHFLMIFILGVICQVVYFINDQSLLMGILIVFSFSIAKPRALLYNKYKVQNEVTVWNTKPQNLREP